MLFRSDLESQENTIELELDFSPNQKDDDGLIIPNLDPKNYEHMKDINKLNDSSFLENLEDKPANTRINNTNED